MEKHSSPKLFVLLAFVVHACIGQEAGVFQFTKATIRVSESSSEALITIENTGNTSVPARLRLTSTDLTATSGVDYLLSDQPVMVRFRPGDTLKTHRVLIIDDAITENDESFQLGIRFYGPATPGVRIGSPSVVTVTIEDNDAPMGTIASAVDNITLDTEANITVVCKPDYIEVVLMQANFPGIVVNDSVLHLEDVACVAGYKDADMVKFTFELDSCKTMIKVEADMIYYMNNVYLTADPDTDNSEITRKNAQVIPFSCGYEKKATLSKISYSPRSTLVITDAEGFGNFTYEMDMYTDETNSQVVTEFPYPVGLGLPMYFGFRVKSGDGQLNVFPDACKATAGSDFDSTPDHPIIENACPRDSTLEYDYEPEDEHFFSVDAFRFKRGYDDVYIHCKLTVCREEDSESRCAKGCQENRRRRSVSSDDLTVSLTLGPLRLSDETNEAVEKKTTLNADESASSGSLAMIVGALVGVLGTVAIALVIAVVVITRRRRYATEDKSSMLVVAEDI
ncbi:ZP domain-containing protein-like [Montipora capricornis]|uniref:ZP domain-containing protein-like n=1 Tax=Montipora capricornis TaxID=246305 RepID=UPI0035F1108A